MDIDSFFSANIKAALKNDPPGEWMPALPENCIRLSSGYPDPALVPADQIKKAVASLIEEERDLPLHYLGSPKVPKLKQQIKGRLSERGIHVSEEEVLITSGACQAIDLIARIIIDDQTIVAVESPTYMEALEIFQNYTKHFITIPVDEHGLDTKRLEEVLEERRRKGLILPRILYTIPTFQNPTGTTMALERRKHVLELASEYNFLILEDDAYGELYFREQSIPLKAMDHESRVLYVGSLSKVVAPGMRIGWVTAAPEFITALDWFKKDIGHPFSQATMASFLERNDLKQRLPTLREAYKKKCDVLLSALEQYMPESVTWYVPEGGYFVWARVPGIDTSDLLTESLEEGVSFVPGKYFFKEQEEGTEFLRLSFSYADQKEMEEGIEKLSKVIKEKLS
ncbi:PLP-dependent aminotransferase family protein [Pseudalkalibacillus caeni]|uniref:PLP-dependent aminotransferase family protein n=1 Tax=Exobacillus caeni TaxID=2574798 RepID=A0A5R9F1S4_9BACL|nr:PLP-dependent aminotransferase family protein [Pseudalkalibacillus caeni]TLS35398.1 PLP-dependent aminotransferase family protein [Pseudalkalibacillus caeni]